MGVPLEEALRICEARSAWEWTDATDRAVAEEIRCLVLTLALRPACTISYRRRAFVGSRFEPGLRLTKAVQTLAVRQYEGMPTP